MGDDAFKTYINNKYKNVANNSEDYNYYRVKVAIESGCDGECGDSYNTYLYQAYNNSFVSQSTIDTAVGRIFTKMFELGVMDEPQNEQYWYSLGAKDIDTLEHRQVALDAAKQGIVLLKNENNILPLDIRSNLNIALIGPHANATQVMLSNYHGSNTVSITNFNHARKPKIK